MIRLSTESLSTVQGAVRKNIQDLTQEEQSQIRQVLQRDEQLQKLHSQRDRVILELRSQQTKLSSDRESDSSSNMARYVLRVALPPSQTIVGDSREGNAVPRVEKGLKKFSRALAAEDNLRRSLHLNAQIPLEPLSERSIFSPLRKNLRRLETNLPNGLRRVSHSDAVLYSQVNPKLLFKPKKTAAPTSGLKGKSPRDVHDAAINSRPAGHEINVNPIHPAKRPQLVFNNPEIPPVAPPPLLTTDPQLRLAFGYDDGQLEIYVMRCRNLPPLSVKQCQCGKDRLPNPYVKIYLIAKNGVEIKRKTRAIYDTVNPEYDEVLRFPLERASLSTWNVRIAVCTKRGFWNITKVLEETDFTVTERFLSMTYPIWIHFYP